MSGNTQLCLMPPPIFPTQMILTRINIQDCFYTQFYTNYFTTAAYTGCTCRGSQPITRRRESKNVGGDFLFFFYKIKYRKPLFQEVSIPWTYIHTRPWKSSMLEKGEGWPSHSITAGGCRGFIITLLTWQTWRLTDPLSGARHHKYWQACLFILFTIPRVSSTLVPQRSLQNLQESRQWRDHGLFWVQALLREQQAGRQPARALCGPPLSPTRTPLIPAVMAARGQGGHSGGPGEDLWDPAVLFSYEKGITNKLLRASA